MKHRLAAALTLAAAATLTVGTLTAPTASAKVVAPKVTGVSLPYGSITGGATVTVSGTNLSGASAVKFGTTAGTKVKVVSSTKVTVTTPAHAAGTVDVRVTTAGGTSAVATADRFSYSGAPVVSSVSPNHGPTDGSVEPALTGTGFYGVTSVKLDGTPIGFITFSSGQISPVLPAHAEGAVKLTVTAVGGTSAPVTYYYVDKPVIHITPASGPAAGGTQIQITGSGLIGLSSITIDGVPQVFFTTLEPTGNKTYVFTDAHAAGPVAVRATTYGGTSDPVTFTYTS